MNALAGDALLSERRPAEAIPFLTQALAAGGQNLAAESSLARAYLQIGEVRLALQRLKAAAPIDMEGSLHHLLARGLRQTGQTDAANEALERYKQIEAAAAKRNAVPEITAPQPGPQPHRAQSQTAPRCAS